MIVTVVVVTVANGSDRDAGDCHFKMDVVIYDKAWLILGAIVVNTAIHLEVFWQTGLCGPSVGDKRYCDKKTLNNQYESTIIIVWLIFWKVTSLRKRS